MASLRDRSKKRRRDQILDVARGLFQSKGFTKTGLAEIADQSEVSIGTIYSYFGSKGAIYYELSRPLLMELGAKADRVIQSPPNDPVEAMLALFDALRLTKDWQDLNLLKGFDMNQPEQDKFLEQTQKESHELVLKKVYALLLRLQLDGKLRSDLDLEDATFLLAANMRGHLELFIERDGALPFPELARMMDRRVRLLFERWPASKAKPKIALKD